MRRSRPATALKRADLAAFTRVARWDAPRLDRVLPRLSTAANHGVLWVAVAALLASLGGRSGRRAALRGLVALGFASFASNLPAKLLLRRQRPPIALVPAIRHLARLPLTWSLPSGHSASAAAFATGVALEQPRVAAPVGALALGVGFSRVYTGVHYPGDVAVGAAIGFAAATVSVKLWPRVRERNPLDRHRSWEDSPIGPSGEGLKVVVNEAAGSDEPATMVEQITTTLPRADVIVCTPQETAGALRDLAPEVEVLAVAGGDGTVRAAAAAAHAEGMPLLVFPGGTLNHFARDLGIDTVDDAVRAFQDGRLARVDLAEVETALEDDITFCNAASLGIYPPLVDERETLQGTIGKWPALLISLVRVLRAHEPIDLTIDGHTMPTWMLFVGNGRYVPDGFVPAVRPCLDDGLLDVRMVTADLAFARTRLIAALITGRLERCRVYHSWTARTLPVVGNDDRLRVALDGETVDAPGTIRFGKAAEPLRVFVSTAAGHRAGRSSGVGDRMAHTASG